jgi:hypothetical protein
MYMRRYLWDDLIELNVEEDMDKKISIAWIDLTLRVEKNLFRKEKIILNHINGCFELRWVTHSWVHQVPAKHHY